MQMRIVSNPNKGRSFECSCIRVSERAAREIVLGGGSRDQMALTVPIYNYINCLFLALGLSCGMRYPVTSNISPRISLKKNIPQITV